MITSFLCVHKELANLLCNQDPTLSPMSSYLPLRTAKENQKKCNSEDKRSSLTCSLIMLLPFVR